MDRVVRRGPEYNALPEHLTRSCAAGRSMFRRLAVRCRRRMWWRSRPYRRSRMLRELFVHHRSCRLACMKVLFLLRLQRIAILPEQGQYRQQRAKAKQRNQDPGSLACSFHRSVLLLGGMPSGSCALGCRAATDATHHQHKIESDGCTVVLVERSQQTLSIVRSTSSPLHA